MYRKLCLLMSLVFALNIYSGFIAVEAADPFSAQALATQAGDGAMTYQTTNTSTPTPDVAWESPQIPTNSGITYDGVLFRASAVDEYIAFKVDVPAAETYTVIVGAVTSYNRGKYQLSIDGNNIGDSTNYHTGGNEVKEFNFGEITFSRAGYTEFKFTCSEVNSGDNNILTLLYITLDSGEQIELEPGPVHTIGKTFHVEDPSQATYVLQNGDAEEYDKVVNSTQYKGIEFIPGEEVDGEENAISFSVVPERSGKHVVSYRAIASPDGGKYQFYIADTPVGEEIDLYAEQETVVERMLGEGQINVDAETQPVDFKFVCTDKGDGNGILTLGHITIIRLGIDPVDGIVYQAEELNSTTDGGTKSNITIETDKRWLADNANYFGVLYQALDVNQNISFTVNVQDEGIYDIFSRAISGFNRGVYELYIDDEQIGDQVDLYSSATKVQDLEYGRLLLTAGDHTFKFVCTNRGTAPNTNDQEGYLALDYIALAAVTEDIVVDVGLFDDEDLPIEDGDAIAGDSFVTVKGNLTRNNDDITRCEVIAVLLKENGAIFSVDTNTVVFDVPDPEPEPEPEPLNTDDQIDIMLPTPEDTTGCKVRVFIWNVSEMKPIVEESLTLWESIEEPDEEPDQEPDEEPGDN